MDEKDQIELVTRRLIEDVRENVEKTLRVKYTWLGIILTALTAGGGTLIINSWLDQYKGIVIKGEVATDRANDVAAKAETALASLEKKQTAFMNQTQDSQDLTKGLMKAIQETNERVEAISEELKTNISDLTSIVEKSSKQEKGNISNDVEKLRTSLTDTGNTITRLSETKRQLTEINITIEKVDIIKDCDQFSAGEFYYQFKLDDQLIAERSRDDVLEIHDNGTLWINKTISKKIIAKEGANFTFSGILSERDTSKKHDTVVGEISAEFSFKSGEWQLGEMPRKVLWKNGNACQGNLNYSIQSSVL